MRDLLADLAPFEGLARQSQLVELGYTPTQLRRAVRDSLLRRIRRSWLAAPSAPQPAVRAVELGGRLTSALALRSFGVWTATSDFAVAVDSRASRLPVPADHEQRLWMRDQFVTSGKKRWRVSVLDAIAHLATTRPVNEVAASLDSALHNHLINVNQVAVLEERCPRLRGIGRRLDSAAESGLETLMRLALDDAGFRVETQMKIPGVGRVDMLVNGQLIVECDGRRWHDEPEAHHRDRLRDAAATLDGYRFQRFSYGQVMFSLEHCVDVVRAVFLDAR